MSKQQYNIFLEELTLEYFRSFQNLNIRFEEQLTVIIAENGGGKTAILEAIAGCLKNYLAQLQVKGYKKSNIPFKDVSFGQKGSSLCLLTADLEYAVVESDYDFGGKPTSDVLSVEEIVTLDYTYSFNEKIHSQFKEVALPFKKIDIEATKIPVLVYFGGESVSVNYNSKLSSTPDKLQIIYQNALEGERFAFTHFYNWWKGNEDRMLRMKKKSDEKKSNEKPSEEYNTIFYQFEKIRTAVEYLMNDDEKQPIYQNLRINEDLLMGMDKIIYENGIKVGEPDFIEISQFSAGEKALFAYVADLGLRLLHANPLDVSAEKEGLFEIRGRGVALIDEVGLHLHPKWQQKVIGKLLEVFPEMQFVVTTHSPLILGGLSSKNIRIVDKQNVYKPEDTYGREIDDILEIVMKVDAGIFTKTIQKIAKRIAEGEVDEAEKLIAELKTKINKQGDDGEHHPDILRMSTLLTRKKLIGR
jgi:predicted ATP-binding protein involved in virulence